MSQLPITSHILPITYIETSRFSKFRIHNRYVLTTHRYAIHGVGMYGLALEVTER